MNPYNNKYTFHPLSKEEIFLIDKVWQFLEIFKYEKLTKSLYIKNIIKKVNEMYKLVDFFIYETITEKCYWNLCNAVLHTINISDTIKENTKDDKSKILIKLLKESVIGKSSIRKAFVYNKYHHSFMYKYNYPNDFDLLVFSIIENRSIYETFMSNPDISLNELNELTKNSDRSAIEFDFPFPNLNTLKPFMYSSKERIENIKKMYYVQNASESWTLNI